MVESHILFQDESLAVLQEGVMKGVGNFAAMLMFGLIGSALGYSLETSLGMAGFPQGSFWVLGVILLLVMALAMEGQTNEEKVVIFLKVLPLMAVIGWLCWSFQPPLLSEVGAATAWAVAAVYGVVLGNWKGEEQRKADRLAERNRN